MTYETMPLWCRLPSPMADWMHAHPAAVLVWSHGARMDVDLGELATPPMVEGGQMTHAQRVDGTADGSLCTWWLMPEGWELRVRWREVGAEEEAA